MNRRGFFGALAGLLALPGLAIASLRRKPCDHHMDKLMFTPGEDGESGFMRCLCGECFPICRDNRHPNWEVGRNYCPDCGITLKKFWLKKFGPPPKYKITRHRSGVNGCTFSYDQYEPIKS